MFKQKQKHKDGELVIGHKDRKCAKSEKIWRITNRITVVMIIILGVGYVVSINSLSIKGFVLREYKNKTTGLKTEQDKIELQIMALESYDTISQKALAMKMVKSGQVNYLMAAGSNEVAKK